MIHVGERVERGNLVLSAPEDPSRSMPVAKGAFFLFESWRPLCAPGCTRYEFRGHPTLAVDFVHASPSPILENQEETWARSFPPVLGARRFFPSALITIVPSVDFQKSMTMATVADDKLRDSSRPLSCSDFVRG